MQTKYENNWHHFAAPPGRAQDWQEFAVDER
jgi:hypothetical protein